MMRRYFPVLLFVLVAVTAWPRTGESSLVPLAAGTQQRRLTLEQVIPDRPALGAATDLQWSPDGRRLGYLLDDGETQELWSLEPAKGRLRCLLRTGDPPAGRSGGKRETISHMDAFHWSPDGDAVLLEAAGDLHLLPLDGHGPSRLTSTEETETDPKFAPGGARVAFVRGQDLHLLDLKTGRERVLTAGGAPGTILNGQTDWVYWEEIWNRHAAGFWWSPDGGRIAYYRFDESPVPGYPLLDATLLDPEVDWQKYPKPGEAIPRVKVGVLDLSSGQTVWMSTGREQESYLARVAWTPAGQLAVQRLNRSQDRLDLLVCEPATGYCRRLLTEKARSWINLRSDLTFLADGRFLWASERDGWWRIFLYDAQGALQGPVTPAGWSVTSLDGVDQVGGWITCTAFHTEPWGATDRQVLRVRLEAKGEQPRVEVYTTRDGWNTALVAPETGYWVHTWSDADTPPVREVRGPGLARPWPLPSAPRPEGDPADLPQWEFLTIQGRGGTMLPARILRPGEVRPGRRYPVIMYHYGCPASQVVMNRWDARGRDLWHKMMAQRGFGILIVDNETSIFFGRKGEGRADRRFGELNLAAQMAGVAYLNTLSWVDPERIGLWGWSGGGSNTLYSLLNRPGVWRAGVAGAPVTDWRFYDAIWTERYLDRPGDNPDGYRDSSPITYAGQLADALLIVHGTADDNVHPQNTLAFIDQLVQAGLPFEDAIYPRQKHGFRGPSVRHFFARMTEFFQRHLQGGETVENGGR